MPPSTFEKILPWTGAVAGVCWVAQDALQKVYTVDKPGAASAALINDNMALNIGSLAGRVLMGIALLCFAAAIRNLLRSGEAREATYSSVAYGAFVTVAAAVGQMAMWQWIMFGAAEDKNAEAVKVLGYAQYAGWMGMGIGVAAGFLAVGLGGLSTATLPRWFAIASVVLGVLETLGACHIPPGGLVAYVLLPLWLVGAAIIVARRQKAAAVAGMPDHLIAA
ncbi:hypothetical protein [Nocardioides sp. Kera G14]|uniref:hypothetical protein n=1 Tax=Nocardioides sp. Kera G14 TaxID=2884264 RepID=UPI001D108F9D|nr:hypothetical protein [Nocardioides sp. Kera G14]UDY22891.1 hypothetical protein LH076_12545 [Nocardioides sp. Kera G14]